jgi:hypothetical protein
MIFCVTQKPGIIDTLRASLVCRYAGWQVAFRAGDFLSRLQSQPDRVRLVASPLHALDRDAQGMESSVTLESRTGQFQLYRNTNSGIPIYWHRAANGDFLASTSIAELTDAGVTLREDASGLPEFFAYCSLTPHRQLAAGGPTSGRSRAVDRRRGGFCGVRLLSGRQHLQAVDSGEDDGTTAGGLRQL